MGRRGSEESSDPPGSHANGEWRWCSAASLACPLPVAIVLAMVLADGLLAGLSPPPPRLLMLPWHGHAAEATPGAVQWPAGGGATKVKQAKHMDLLNRESFWWSMGSFIIIIGMSVVRVELGSRAPPPPPTKESSPACDGPDEVQTLQDLEAVSSKAKRMETLRRILKLLYCVVSLNVSQLMWGIAQEFVMTNNYGLEQGVEAKIPSALFVVLCNRVSSAMFTGWVVWLHGQSLKVPGCLIGGKAAFSNGVSSWSQYQSLNYISFTLQTTAKSAKMLPVLLMSSCRGKRHTPVDYAETLVIVCALVVFGWETDGRESKESSSMMIGVMLLCVLLFFDSCTPHLQDQLFSRHPEVTAVQATFAMSSFAAGGIFCIQVLSGVAFTCFRFLSVYPNALLHLFVLSLASTLTQYFISYTVKNFGPTVFTLIASTRQVIAVCISAALFKHQISTLASVAVALVFSMVVVRALRSFAVTKKEKAGRSQLRLGQFAPLLVCAVSLHALHFSYGAAQEFLSTHRFGGERFDFPQFKVVVNHWVAALVGFCSLRARRLELSSEERPLKWTLLPALAIFLATTCQHMALNFISFQAQTLLKTLKVIPVMLVGRVLGNRRYSLIDIAEGLIITALCVYFVRESQPSDHPGKEVAYLGVVLMLGYIVLDSFTCNLQDVVYQKFSMDPAQVLFGMEAVSASWATISFLVFGEPSSALEFLFSHKEVWSYVALLALFAAIGAYACTIVVRMFGPAVFTLLMASRQALSRLVSALLFGHRWKPVNMLCLVALALVMLTSALRRVSTQLAIKEAPASPKLPPKNGRRKASGEAVPPLSLGKAGGKL